MMLNIKELTQHVTTADRARFQKGCRYTKGSAPQVVAVTIEGVTVLVSAPVLSRIAKVVPVVDACIGVAHAAKGGATVPVGRHVPNDSFVTYSWDIAYTVEHKALILTSGTTTWTLYHQEIK